MSAVTAFLSWVINQAGAAVMMPVIIFLLGLIFGARPGRSFRAAVSIGVGFTGLFLVLGMLIGALAPATQAMSKRFDLHLTIVDVGWPTLAAISFGTPYAFTLFLAIFALNVLLILLRFTRTLDIDLWNYWSFAYVFSMVWIVTHSFWLALLAAAIYAAFCFKLADWTAPVLADYFKMPGISLPHGDTVVWSPIGMALDALWDRIPVIRDIRIEAGELQRRLGVLGDPMIVGLVIGLVIGVLGYGTLPMTPDALAQILRLGVTAAAFMALMPRMVALLMEGLIPISEAVRQLMARRFPGRQLYLGLDAAVVVGDPAIVATALLLTPVTLLVAAILPGNRVLPFADLSVLVFLLIWAVAPSRGNIFRGLLNGILVVIPLMLLIATDVAPQVTQVAHAVGAEVPQGSTVTAMAAGFKVLSWPLLVLFWALGGQPVGASRVVLALLFLLAYLALWLLVARRPAARFAAGAEAVAAGSGGATARPLQA